jgi:quinol-cytochrome oxidoreductase complex cytochrome b subunit
VDYASILLKSHMDNYPSPININTFYNFGFMITLSIVIQTITGIILALTYSSDTLLAYKSIIHITHEVYYGWLIRYMHTFMASFIFLLMYIHLFRAIIYNSYIYLPISWITGVILFILFIIIGFLLFIMYLLLLYRFVFLLLLK